MYVYIYINTFFYIIVYVLQPLDLNCPHQADWDYSRGSFSEYSLCLGLLWTSRSALEFWHQHIDRHILIILADKMVWAAAAARFIKRNQGQVLSFRPTIEGSRKIWSIINGRLGFLSILQKLHGHISRSFWSSRHYWICISERAGIPKHFFSGFCTWTLWIYFCMRQETVRMNWFTTYHRCKCIYIYTYST
jgi:hypothetical protein